ncbi:GGDEF domain-containing protein [Falcatimonas sp. MSJ-15]|uniref:GGDEF domain-containing protein n=1 Tax=Falcatimonas sp. MSJ-15 TaxID=2841515 RepID=UPI00209EE1D3|nr:GGDEF domain-containing protein [Falcatimonas sp. MSJ-15]
MLEKLKVLMQKVFSKKSDFQEKDVMQNIFVCRFAFVCVIFYTVETILNQLNIFIIDKKIFLTTYILEIIFIFLYVLVLAYMGIENRYSKYLSITAMALTVTITGSGLTYHMFPLTLVPIVIASMYSSKKLFGYAFILSIISITVTTYVGYYKGVCDANMVLITTTSLDKLQKDGVFLLNKVNGHPISTLALYYVFPRSVIAVAFAYLSNSVSIMIRRTMENAVIMESRAERDDMTGLYNKNRLISDIAKNSKIDRFVAVVYWDVNRLKYVNDSYGHYYGDLLITKVAKSIKSVAKKDMPIYRYGGDEFIMLIPDATEQEVLIIIDRWKKVIEQMAKDSDIPLSASVGYAIGKYAGLKKVIEEADKKMYENKKQRRN